MAAWSAKWLFDAAYAGLQKVPLIFVASDDKGVKEAHDFFPWIETVTTENRSRLQRRPL
jgi:D-aminopeptidase